jgi:hypothetical protein
MSRSRGVEPAGESQDRGEGEECGEEHHSAVDPGDDLDLKGVNGEEQRRHGGDGKTRNSKSLLQHPDGDPDENGVEGVEENIRQMKKPGPALHAGVEQVQNVGDGELAGEGQQRQRLVEVAMDDRKKLHGVGEGGMVDENMIQDETVIVPADETAAERGKPHDDGGEDQGKDETGAASGGRGLGVGVRGHVDESGPSRKRVRPMSQGSYVRAG